MVKSKSKFIFDFLWSGILALIFLRPFFSAYAYPCLEKYYRFLLLLLSFLWIILNRKFAIPKFSLFTPLEIPLYQKVKQRFLTGFNYSFLLFIIAIIISTFFSINRQASYEQILNFLPYFAIFYLMSQTEERQKEQVITAMIISATIIGIYTLYQFLFGLRHTLEYLQKTAPYPYAEEFLSRKRAFATFFSPDMLAGYLAMMIPLSLGFIITKTQKVRKNAKFLTIPTILLTALFLTKSLGGILSLAASLFIFISLLKPKNRKLTFVLVVLILLSILPMLLLRASSFLDFRNPQNTIIQRLRYWTTALRIIKDYPLFGVGLGSFADVYLKYKLPYATEIRFVHNSYLQIWAETGILGIIGLLGMIFSFLRKGLISQKNPFQVGLLSAAVAFLFHNLLDFSFFVPEVALNWWVIFSIANVQLVW